MTTVLVIGIKESARVNNLIVILKVAIVLLIVGVGLAHINADNWTPLIPPNTGEWGTFGWSGVLRAAGLVFFAYIGFDAVSTAAQEAKNPQRDMPIGILGSLAICTLLYVDRLGGADRHGALHRSSAATRRWPTPCGGRRAGVAPHPDRRRRGARPRLGDPGDAARPVAGLLLDVARRPDRQVGRRRPPEVPHAVPVDDLHRRRGRPSPPASCRCSCSGSW